MRCWLHILLLEVCQPELHPLSMLWLSHRLHRTAALHSHLERCVDLSALVKPLLPRARIRPPFHPHDLSLL